MRITIEGVALDVKPCDSCEGTRVVSDGLMVGHVQQSHLYHRNGHGLETSKLCALGQRLYGGTIVRPSRSEARMASLRKIAGWVRLDEQPS
jgi:hypothetical protein